MPQVQKAYKKIVNPILNPHERLSNLQGIKGMWRNRKPGLIKELRIIRKERERKII